MTPPPLSRTQSLRWQLPTLISLLIMAVLAIFLWVAYQGVRRTLVETAGTRAREVANQIGSMLVQSGLQRRTELLRVAADPAVRAYVQNPGGDATAVRARLATLALPNGAQIIELWNSSGENVLSLPIPADAASALPPTVPPSTSTPKVLRQSGNVVYSEAFVPVESGGFLVVHRPMNASGSDALNRVIGSGAAIEVGNKADNVWTDLAKQVPPPAVDLARRGVAQVRVVDGQRRLGVLADLRDAPLQLWLDFPESAVLAPARLFLRRMVIFAIAAVAVAALLTAALSARLTTPLHQLTQAAEALAAGKYSPCVVTTRRDEVGRLGAAFNAMTEELSVLHRDLERRVEERTASLTEARAEVDRFFSLSVDMLCIKHIDGSFKRVNPAWQATLGWTADELLALPLADLVHPDDAAASAGELSKLSAGQATVNFENRYRCTDGSYRWLAWNAAGLPERGVVYAAVRDVTEQKQAAVELARHAAELSAVNDELEAFSYSVSHDLRAPLRHVTGFASLLQRSAADRLVEKETRYVGTIVAAASRMGRLIDDLLAFSKMGRTPIDRRRVSLADLVRDARADVPCAARIAWTVHPLPEVDGDPALLRQVFVNLLSNAAKYSGARPDPAVEIGVQRGEPGETVIYVRDNGVGFDMKYVDKLFGVFQRLHSSDQFEGTGIGLANVRRIVHRHGGRVWAAGAVDAGATFYVSLPLMGEA
ncbi:MAG: multi-sensor signal transduction histidine kinase [Acidobacteria bacterium]|nr:multi-sensor signal transduction histidine kinase [Acidobacteriota bacterium]